MGVPHRLEFLSPMGVDEIFLITNREQLITKFSLAK